MSLVAVLTNPKSTRNLSSLEKVRAVVDNYNGIFHYEIADVSDIPMALSRFADFGAELLVINGGDGTIQATFSALVTRCPFEKMPPVAILPAGKTNMIAEDLGITSPKPHLYLRQLLDQVSKSGFEKCMVERHLLKVDGIPGMPPLYGMFLGTAGIVEGIRMCRRRIYPMGLPNFLAHTAAVSMIVISALTGGIGTGGNPSPIQVHLDGRGMVMGRYFVVIATTLDRLILGFRPFSKDGHGPVKFLSVENGPLTVLRSLWLAITGGMKKKTIPGMSSRNVSTIKLKLDAAVTLDGELYEMKEGGELHLSSDEKLRFVHFGRL